MTKTINLYALPNADFIQMMNDALAIINRNNTAALKVTKQYNNLNNANALITGLYNSDAANRITPAVIAGDVRRDTAIIGISAVIAGYVYHYDPTTSAAAKLLNNHLATYGAGIARLSYQTETTVLKDILTDWKNKPELAAAIVLLNLTDWVLELETANEAFNSIYLDRTQDIGAAPTDKMKDKRAVTINAYYELRNKLDAFFVISEDEEVNPYVKVLNELNALIDQYNRLLSSRGGGDVPPTPPTVISQ